MTIKLTRSSTYDDALQINLFILPFLVSFLKTDYVSLKSIPVSFPFLNYTLKYCHWGENKLPEK